MAELDIEIGTDRVLGKNHSSLENLDYESSGHTGFQKAEEGKGLSTNDFSNEYRAKLEGLQNYDDTELRNTIASKQEALVAGTNIKTINNQSILGSGNITIEGGGGSSAEIEFIDSNSINIWELDSGKYITSYNSTEINYHNDYEGTVSKIDVPTFTFISVEKGVITTIEDEQEMHYEFMSYTIHNYEDGIIYSGNDVKIYLEDPTQPEMVVGTIVSINGT